MYFLRAVILFHAHYLARIVFNVVLSNIFANVKAKSTALSLLRLLLLLLDDREKWIAYLMFFSSFRTIMFHMVLMTCGRGRGCFFFVDWIKVELYN